MSRSETVWIVDDDRSIRWVLEKALQQEGMTTQSFDSADGVMSRLARQQPDVIISDIRMPGASGLDLLARIREQHPRLPVIIMTAHSDLDSAVASYQGGAFEYLPKPFDVDEAVALVKRANQHAQEQQNQEAPPALTRTPEIIGEAPAMQEVFRAIGRLSHSNITVLINGESGTGKELVAHALHRHSPRAASPFIALNMAAIPKDLMESELFGHEKGAFTGAANLRRGRFEQADGGTLFLDEIGDLPMSIQVKLLRVLQEREVVRLGSRKSIPINVRVLAATNVQLEKAINAGHFREDLFYRLNVVNLELSPLRDRPGDILPLVQYFIDTYTRRLGYGEIILSKEAEQRLATYSWPGNIRELENVIHHTLLICRDGVIQADDLRMSNLRIERQEDSTTAHDLLDQAFQRLFEEQIENLHEQVERSLLTAAYRLCQHNQVHTAELLGLSRNVTRTLLINLGELKVNKRRPLAGAKDDRVLHLSI